MFYVVYSFLFLSSLTAFPAHVDQVEKQSSPQKIACSLCKEVIDKPEHPLVIIHENELLAPCFFHQNCLTNYVHEQTELKTCPCGQEINKKLLQSEPARSGHTWHASDPGHSQHMLHLSEEEQQKFKNDLLPIMIGTCTLIAGGAYLLSWFI